MDQTVFYDSSSGWCWSNNKLKSECGGKDWTHDFDQGVDNGFVNGAAAHALCKAKGIEGSCRDHYTEQFTNSKSASDCDNCNFSEGQIRDGCNCAWKCDNGYVKCGNKCQRGHNCPSKGHWKAREFVLACTRGTVQCSTPNGGYECLDTQSDLEACGGCPGSDSSVDCSAMPNVRNVQCVDGQCQISSCLRGSTLIDGQCL